MRTFSLRRLPQTDEWKVSVKDDGVPNEASSYYTDDKRDAEQTMKVMQDSYMTDRRAAQETVIRNALAPYCGSSFTVRNVENAIRHLMSQIRTGPNAWAFK